MWEYIFGGATIFGAIVTLGAWLNGRAIRKYIGKLIEEEGKRTRELIEEEGKRTRELLEKLSEQHMTIISILKESK